MTKKYQELYDNQADARQLANNIFTNLDFNFFSYGNIDFNGMHTTLTTNANLTNEIRNQSKSLSYQAVKDLIASDNRTLLKINDHYFLPDANHDNKQLTTNLGVSDAALLIKEVSDSFDIFIFGSKNENYVSQLALIHPIVFIEAKYNFLDKGQKLINNLTKYKVKGRTAITTSDNTVTHNPEEFLRNSKTNFYHMSLDNGRRIKISNKERLVMLYLSHAQTVKEISKKMGIAESTVNTHIDNIKNKLGVYTRSNMMRFYLQSDLIFLHDLNFMSDTEQNSGRYKR